MSQLYQGIIQRYREFLPLQTDAKIISLCEGSTPLIRLQNLAELIQYDIELYVKYEGLNPTGSFKDRGMTMAVTESYNQGVRAIICASTGNTSAACAAYAARAGLQSFVLIPEGKIALGKLAQAMLHGAHVIQIKGNFDAGMALVKKLGQSLPIAIVNSINPARLQGQKTAAFEIVDALGAAPDYQCLPVGNAGNITAYWLGYNEYATQQRCQLPIMCGYQASGAAPFLQGAPVQYPETVATAIRIGNPRSWDGAMTATTASNGWFCAFSDDVILATQKLLADNEGIFCEPASAVAVAGALADIRNGRIPASSRVVCTLTGHGLKDPDIAIQQSAVPTETVAATLADIKALIADKL